MTRASTAPTAQRLAAAATDAIRRADWPKAEATLRRLVKLRDAPAEASYNLAQVLLRAGKPEQAGSWLRRAVSLRADYGIAWFELGRWLVEQGEPAEARDCFARATVLLPEDTDGWRNLARLAERLGDPAQARDAWRRIAGAGFAEARVGLMRALLELRDPEGEVLRRALWREPALRPLVLRAVTRSTAGRIALAADGPSAQSPER
ncbi:MAG: tetratricopeptide repeat protein [Alphaproteobacteria bacterium]